jgi:hypothetical protein
MAQFNKPFESTDPLLNLSNPKCLSIHRIS